LVIFILRKGQAIGSLIGMAIGDAMGAPLEGLPAPAERVAEMTGGGRHTTHPGQYTDDTLQAAALAESLVASGGFVREDVMRRLIAGYRARPEFYGPTSSAVFTLILDGMGMDEAAFTVHQKNQGSRSNGSIMRGPPLGIFFPPEAVRGVSLSCSRLTHYDPDAAEASAFINQMVSAIVRGASRMQAFASAFARCESGELKKILADYREYPVIPSLDAVLTTHAAVAVFMEAPTYEEAIVRTINLGGDADTLGAICGALAGGFFGIDTIPSRWLQTLQDREYLLDLSIRLFLAAHA
jgi:ADP-ribosyl-[dinitrogen reductase] hydrolase